MRRVVLLSFLVVATAALTAGCASKLVQTQTSAAQTQEAQTQAAGQSEAPEEKSRETEARADDGKVYELRTSSNQIQPGTIGRALEFFCKTVEEKFGGRIETAANFGDELGSQSERVEMCQVGALEMVAAVPGIGPGTWVPEPQMFEFPLLLKDNEEYRGTIKTMRPEVSKRLEQHGFVACGGQSMGAGGMFTVASVTKLENMKGLKTRGPNNIYISMFDCLGVSGTTMDWNEVYTALQTKVMDGMEASPPMINSMRFQDNARSPAVTNHYMACVVYFFNRDWHDSLSQDLQQIIMEPVGETVVYQARTDDENDDKALEEMKAEGIVITEIQDIDKWKEVCAPMLEEYRAKGDNWNSFIDMISEAQK